LVLNKWAVLRFRISCTHIVNLDTNEIKLTAIAAASIIIP
jgi:hypothetical protein